MPKQGYWNEKKNLSSYQQFKDFYNKNPDAQNAELYAAFPDRPRPTISRWKMKFLNEITP